MCLQSFFCLPSFWEYIAPWSFTLSCLLMCISCICPAIPRKWMSAGTKWQTSLFTVSGDWGQPLPCCSLKVQRLFTYITVLLIQCVLFCHLVNTDAVMAGSGHFSPVTSVEAVPSTVAGGLRPEVPLLASEEGIEWYRNGQHIDKDLLYHLINVPYVFAIPSWLYI